jgi:uncharacterized protein (UPF0305 family)
MIRAALPYMKPRTQKAFEILVKTDELMNTIQNLDTAEISTLDIKPTTFDMEAFLTQMRTLSNQNESEMIDNLLHFIKMQKLLTAYKSFMTAKPENTDDFMDFFLSQMAPEQKANYENINMMFQAMNGGSL